MPLVSHNGLPAFERLRKEGKVVLDPDRAQHQDIRELHIGLLNMMPDAAIAATERQFFRLVGGSNPIAQFYMHPFTLKELQRGPDARAHLDQYYESFEQIREEGLDALIITGANVTHPDLSQEPFWEPLIEVMDWALENVTSTLCSCLATHAVLQFNYRQKRRPLPAKRWGVYRHRVMDKHHPLVSDVNTVFDVPHSRFNEISSEQFEGAGLHVLVESEEAGPHLAVSGDGLRVVVLQGHPEYDTTSLLKEYKREVLRYAKGERIDYPSYPDNYFRLKERAILDEYRRGLNHGLESGDALTEFPEALVAHSIDNTWHDTAKAVVSNWMGIVYQVTHRDRSGLFMEGIDPLDPLELGW
jgi:homoserine O-succinyltransferase